MSVNLLQHPSLRLSISKSQTLRPQRIQGKELLLHCIRMEIPTFCFALEVFFFSFKSCWFSLFLGPETFLHNGLIVAVLPSIPAAQWYWTYGSPAVYIQPGALPQLHPSPGASWAKPAGWLASNSPAVVHTHLSVRDEHMLNAVTSPPEGEVVELSVTAKTKKSLYLKYI